MNKIPPSNVIINPWWTRQNEFDARPCIRFQLTIEYNEENADLRMRGLFKFIEILIQKFYLIKAQNNEMKSVFLFL